MTATAQPEPSELLASAAMACTYAILAGQATVTLSLAGKPPAGFPRGELLSVGANGSRNMALEPLRVLAWVQRTVKQTAAAKLKP